MLCLLSKNAKGSGYSSVILFDIDTGPFRAKDEGRRHRLGLMLVTINILKGNFN